jgi:hypothetical protein
MSWRIGVFRSENGPNAENALSASRNLELFIELGRLGEVCFLTEIGKFEDVSTALRRRTD